jgi:transglutaminase-like putative cysteine protease
MDVLHQSRTMPMIWMPWDRVMMQAYLQTPELPESELFELAAYAMEFARKNQNDAIAIISDINKTNYRNYTYIQGETSLNTTPQQVYITKEGVCQDFANLLICLIRLLGIPARYRVGYIYTETDYANQAQSDATHAWVEAYFPYIGWLGFDPTNGCLIEKNHIRVACGRHYNDATPTSCTLFKAEEDVEETLSTSVEVVLLNL